MAKINLTESEFVNLVQNTVRRVMTESTQPKQVIEMPKTVLKIKLSELKEVVKQVLRENEDSPYPEDIEYDSRNDYGDFEDEKSTVNEDDFSQLIPIAAGTVGVFLASAGIGGVITALRNGSLGDNGKKLAAFLNNIKSKSTSQQPQPPQQDEMSEEAKPSAGMSKSAKSNLVKKAKAGGDIGKKGKGFQDVASKAAKEYGSKEAGERVAAAAMWKNAHK